MKKANLLLLFTFGWTLMLSAQEVNKEQKILQDAEKSKAAFVKADPGLKKLMNSSAGYAIFPNVGKGGLGVGGATGNGILYERGKPSGTARLTQLTIGFQAGGQVYQELLLFENEESLSRFKDNKFELSAQLSAVAAASGVSADAKYNEGVLVFTLPKKGLMYEATVGGQKFTYKPLK